MVLAQDLLTGGLNENVVKYQSICKTTHKVFEYDIFLLV